MISYIIFIILLHLILALSVVIYEKSKPTRSIYTGVLLIIDHPSETQHGFKLIFVAACYSGGD
jgi:hypothetical protein